jgi:hypothetical protein
MRVFAALVLLASAGLPTAGCSPVSYPSMFPAVEQSPPPRVEAPMDANQVQQATEDLIGDRNRLNGQPVPGTPAAKPPANSSAQIATPAAATTASVPGQ